MHFQSAIALLLTAAVTNAAIVDMFSDGECNNLIDSRNVWDNSCAPVGGFSSYRITYPGGNYQRITAYSRNACVEPEIACNSAQAVGECVRAFDGNGASNALGSGANCGTISP